MEKHEQEILDKINKGAKQVGNKLETFGKRRIFGNTVWVMAAFILVGIAFALLVCR